MISFDDVCEVLLTNDLNKITALPPEVINQRNKYGEVPLMSVVHKITVEALRVCISRSDNLNVVSDTGHSVVHNLIEENALHEILKWKEKLRSLVSGGADINLRAWNNWTPLHQAVSYGSYDVVKELLALGADKSLRTDIDDNETPLEIAKRKGSKELVTLLRNEQRHPQK